MLATRALTCSVDQLLAHDDWFTDPSRPAIAETAPPILVLENFYEDPEEIRRQALRSRFVSYVPPDPAIVGAELGAQNAYRPGRWLSTALVAYHGTPAQSPFHGERFNPSWLRQRLEKAVGEEIVESSWDQAGDYWNGAFHLVEEGYGVGEGFIHHHYKPGDLKQRGWSGVVYLSPDAPESAGTSIWRSRRTMRCVAGFGEDYEKDPAGFELACLIKNRFNRAVLFRENVWHRLEHGFGRGTASRLTQTLFFEVQ